jgi:hypothetical protein
MAGSKISVLPAASTPLAGTEVLPIVQNSTTTKVSIAESVAEEGTWTPSQGAALTVVGAFSSTGYKMSAWTNPASACNRSITFNKQGGVCYEQSRTTVDIPS